MPPPKQLDKAADYNRYITTRNDKGEAIYSPVYPTQVPELESASGVIYTFDFLNHALPAVMDKDGDLAAFDEASKPGGEVLPATYTTPHGVVLRHVFLPPGLTTPMHKTPTIDFAIVLEGEGEMALDSGETRPLRPHDTVVQRGTNHAFINTSKDKWFHMIAVVMPAEVPQTPPAQATT